MAAASLSKDCQDKPSPIALRLIKQVKNMVGEFKESLAYELEKISFKNQYLSLNHLVEP